MRRSAVVEKKVLSSAALEDSFERCMRSMNLHNSERAMALEMPVIVEEEESHEGAVVEAVRKTEPRYK